MLIVKAVNCAREETLGYTESIAPRLVKISVSVPSPDVTEMAYVDRSLAKRVYRLQPSLTVSRTESAELPSFSCPDFDRCTT